MAKKKKKKTDKSKRKKSKPSSEGRRALNWSKAIFWISMTFFLIYFWLVLFPQILQIFQAIASGLDLSEILGGGIP